MKIPAFRIKKTLIRKQMNFTTWMTAVENNLGNAMMAKKNQDFNFLVLNKYFLCVILACCSKPCGFFNYYILIVSVLTLSFLIEFIPREESQIICANHVYQ